ncbi:MAG: hypothetical protein HC945_00275, partial [Nitrosarchaeum sp.]|nr:hypothetical protein [Nitrosarchaeum sp.]
QSLGKSAEVAITVTNLADSRLRDIAVRLNTERTVGSTTTELPFTSRGTSLEQRVDELLADETHTFTFRIIAEPNAASDVYKVPITVTFSDERENDYTYSDEAGLIISAPPVLDAYIDSMDIYSDKRTGSITFKFVNKGLSEIKLLNIELLPTDNYELLSGADHIYIGNVDSDDFDTQSISIRAETDTLEIPVKITYKDSLNNDHVIETTITRALVSQAKQTAAADSRQQLSL